MVTLCLAGREAEREFYGHISDGSDRVDHAMAREYLARRIANPLQPVAKTRPLPSRGATLAWAQHRICLLADALLRNGALTGEQISAISVHSSLLSRALLELTPTGARDLPVRVSLGAKRNGQELGDLAAGRASVETHQTRRPARCQTARLFWRGVCLFCTSALVKTPSE